MAGWLRRRVSVARGTLLVIAFGVGMLGAGGIIVATVALQTADRESARAQRVDRLTTADVAKIARRIFRIEQPSDAELLRRITEGLRLCARTPRCAGRVRRVAASSSRTAGPADATRRGSPVPSDTTRRRPDRRDGSRPGGGDSSGSTGDASQPPGAQPSPGPSRPIVSISTPAPLPQVRVCTPLVAVDC